MPLNFSNYSPLTSAQWAAGNDAGDIFKAIRPNSAFNPQSLDQSWMNFLGNGLALSNQEQMSVNGANTSATDYQPFFDPVTNTLALQLGGEKGFRVIPNAGAYANHDGRQGLNGLADYRYDANGNFLGQGQVNYFEQPGDGGLMGTAAILALPFAAAAMGIGAGGAAGAAGGAGGTAAGAAAGAGATGAGMLDLGGGLYMTAGGEIVGGTGAFAGATAAEMAGMGLGGGTAAMGAGAAGAGMTDLGGGLYMTPEGSIVGGSGAFTPATAGEMTSMSTSAGAGGGFLSGFGGTGSNLLGPASSLLGGVLGSKGSSNTQTSSTALDPRLDSAVFGNGGLVPTAQGLLGQQVPVGQAAQAQLMQVGSGLLGQQAPNTPTNPYVAGILDDLQRRNQQMLDTSFNSIKDNAVAAGGLGDARQGVAQGVATARAADNFTGQAANFMGNLYNSDQNRVLQQQTLGAGLLAQGQQAPWTPLNNAAQVYGQFRPQTTTVSSNQGGGAAGFLGGALGAAQFAKNAGWWS